MSYAQLDEHFDEHPKYQDLELEHFGLMACAISYCNRLLTDGKVPLKAVRGFGASGRGPELARQLVECGIWAADGTGFAIVGFLDHNPSREKVMARREAERARKEAFRTGVKRAAVPKVVHAGHDAEVRKEGAEDSFGRSTSLHFTSLHLTPLPPTEEISDVPPDSNQPIPFVPRDPPIDAFAGTFAAQAWCEGVTAATGRPCTPLDRFGQRDLTVMLSAHAKGESGGAMMAWIRTVASDYATATANERTFWKLTPRRCSEWLDAGRPKRPQKPGKIVQRDAPGELPCWTPRGTNR